MSGMPASSSMLVHQKSAKKIQEKSRQLKPLKGKLAGLETEIENLEKEKEQISIELCNPGIFTDREIYPQKLKRHSELETRLHECYDEWAIIAQQIEEVELVFSDSE